MRWNRRGQVTAEMAVLFSFVIAALVFMGTYVQRGAQGAVKGNVDSLGQQFNPEGDWKSQTRSHQETTYIIADERTETDSDQCSQFTHGTDCSALDADCTL